MFGDETHSDLPIPHNPDWLVTTGRGGALLHASDTTLSAEVTLEIWPPAGPPNADGTDEHTFHTPNGRVMIAAITASPSDKNVAPPHPGDYKLKARRLATRALEDSDAGAIEEIWCVQFWPAISTS
ncbi:hypothetical protein ABZU76_18545 [Amycolatopsis sp. NPDC005232]|uniref:hypothetical protein n=1 Tax=Amycolatopsis sp. NPDC005232 TaxID=3157027 RepID=UPI0033A0B612